MLAVTAIVLLVGTPLLLREDLRLDIAHQLGFAPGKDAEKLAEGDEGAGLADAVEVVALGAVLPVVALGGAELGAVQPGGLVAALGIGPDRLEGNVGLAQLDARGIGIEVLVNNAGFSRTSGFLQTDQETRRIRPNPSTVTRDETELHYGLGVKYAFTRNWASPPPGSELTW